MPSERNFETRIVCPGKELIFRVPQFEIENDDNQLIGDDAVEENAAARREIIRVLEECNLVSNFSTPEIIFETEKFLKLASKLELLSKRSTKEFIVATLSYMPYHTLRGLYQIIFLTSDVEKLLGTPVFELNISNNYRRLTNAILHKISDITHQSFLRQMQLVMKTISTPQSFETKVFPSFPVFNQNGSPDNRFVRRELDECEREHPTITDYSVTLNNENPIGSCSVISSLQKFKRGFRVFTVGMTDNVSLASDTVVVTGGSVVSCLLPWPSHIEKLYTEEQELIMTLIRVFHRKLVPLE
ncbi:hypothetical protein HK096_006489, partial [Nowakowskiella sp. JEL0078]